MSAEDAPSYSREKMRSRRSAFAKRLSRPASGLNPRSGPLFLSAAGPSTFQTGRECAIPIAHSDSIQTATNMDFGWLYELWQLPNVKAAVVTLILTLFADVVRRVILPRGRVAWGVTYNEHFILPQQQTTAQQTEQPTLPITLPSINVRVRQIFIQNIGRAVADEVEVTINFKPQYWHVFPPILHELPNDQG
jgi:hypothetical protein